MPREHRLAPGQETMMQHEVHLKRVQRHFVQATCTCGWVSSARHSESLAAEEGRDHAILYDGAFSAELE
jgi:hypothetical protein